MLVQELIKEYGLNVVQAYMGHIRDNAETAVRSMLKNVGSKGERVLEAEDFMDDGSRIKLKISINVDIGSAVFDFRYISF